MATRAKSTRPKSEPDDQGGKPNGKTKDQEREQVRPREEEPRSARGSTAKQAGRRSKGSKPSRKAREQQEVQQRAQEILEARRLERPQQQPEDLSEGKWEAEEREAEDRARQEQQFRKQREDLKQPASHHTPADVPREFGLEMEQDLQLQEKEWRFQRAGWIGMGTFILLSLLGLTGSGPLCRTMVGERDSALWVEYDRFGRLEANMTMVVNAQPGAPGEDLRVAISDGYLERVRVEEIQPQPDSVEVGPESQTYVFKTLPADGARKVIFHVRPDHVGRINAGVAVDGGPSVSFQHLVYP